MADEFVCEACAYTSAIDEKVCPLCGGKLISLEDGLDQDLAYSEASNQDDTETMLEDEFDFEPGELPRAA